MESQHTSLSFPLFLIISLTRPKGFNNDWEVPLAYSFVSERFLDLRFS